MMGLLYPAGGAALFYMMADQLPAPINEPLYAALAGGLAGYLVCKHVVQDGSCY